MLAYDLTTLYKRLAFHHPHYVSSNSLKLKPTYTFDEEERHK